MPSAFRRYDNSAASTRSFKTPQPRFLGTRGNIKESAGNDAKNQADETIKSDVSSNHLTEVPKWTVQHSNPRSRGEIIKVTLIHVF
jgi:hypothetical protein